MKSNSKTIDSKKKIKKTKLFSLKKADSVAVSAQELFARRSAKSAINQYRQAFDWLGGGDNRR